MVVVCADRDPWLVNRTHRSGGGKIGDDVPRGLFFTEAALEGLAVRDLRDELGVRIDLRIGREHALHPVLGHQDGLRVDLQRAQRRGGVRR